MRRIHLAVAAGVAAAAAALPASAHVGWTFGISYPGVYFGYGYPGPVYRPHYAYYPRPYYPYPYPYVRRFAYVYPPPPAYYAPRYVQPAPQPAPRAQSRAPRDQAPLAAIPPKRFEKVTLTAKELFAFDKWQLEGSVPKLDEIATALKANPDIKTVTITGYTDRLGTDEYNRALSKRRAESVRFYLMRQGVDGNRLQVVPRGEENPVVTCHQKEVNELIRCLEPNRRIEIEPFTYEKPAATG